jgi:hypothetical protein
MDGSEAPRLKALLRRDGWADVHKLIERIYRKEAVRVPKRKERKTTYKRKSLLRHPVKMSVGVS